MICINIAQYVNDSQYFIAKDSKMDKKAFDCFVRTVIRENAIYRNDTYSLFACNLPREDKIVFLSYLASAQDYEWFMENEQRLEAAFQEFESEMQYFINEQIDEVYHEDMREMSNHLYQPKDEGYFYGVRR